jgi:hypothetical protein
MIELLSHLKINSIFYVIILGLICTCYVQNKVYKYKLHKAQFELIVARNMIAEQNASILTTQKAAQAQEKVEAERMVQIDKDRALAYKNLNTPANIPSKCEDAIKYGVSHSGYRK